MTSPAIHAPAFQTILSAPDGVQLDGFGERMSLAGDTAIVAAKGAGGDAGAVYVFGRAAGGYDLRQKLFANDLAPYVQFGFSIALDGDTLLVGAPQYQTGSVYVFVREGSTWVQSQKLVAADATTSDRFGAAVALVGDTAFIGAPDNPLGGVYVFTRTGGVWSQQSKVTVDGHPHFGQPLAATEDSVFVGANPELYVFDRVGTSLVQSSLSMSTIAGATLRGDDFALSGDTAIVLAGASAHALRKSGGTWIEEGELAWPPHDGVSSIALSGDVAVLGSATIDGPGAAYVYTRAQGTWTSFTELAPPPGTQPSQFGWTASLSEDALFVGTIDGTAYKGVACVYNLADWASSSSSSPPEKVVADSGCAYGGASPGAATAMFLTLALFVTARVFRRRAA